MKFSIKNYLFNILVLIDEAGCSILLGGDPHCTISGWAGTNSSKYLWCSYLEKFIDLLFGKGHCQHYAEVEKKNSGQASWILSSLKGRMVIRQKPAEHREFP